MFISFKKIVTEPFIQFLILGGLLFLLVGYIQRTKDNASRQITVDGDRVYLYAVEIPIKPTFSYQPIVYTIVKCNTLAKHNNTLCQLAGTK